MRCPKCRYISYDASDRCRNCGYEFVLSPVAPMPDAALRTGDEPVGVLADLPLFETGADRRLVTPSAVPRAPLAVRRATPQPARRRARPLRAVDEPALDLQPPAQPGAEPDVTAVTAGTASWEPAGLASRAAAAAIDGVILGAINVAVVYFTMRVAGLTPGEWAVLPIVPLAAFLLLLDIGYSIAFTAAGGQTIGKMALRIRVVRRGPDAGAASEERVDLGSAMLRSAACLVSVAGAGIGLVPALFGRTRRTLHDHLAATQVVRTL
jgi:uncharacterized RDD family membrane protein YckC